MKRNLVAVLLATAMLTSALAGCGKTNQEEVNASSTSTNVESSETVAESVSEPVEEEKPTYPLDTDVTFTYFMEPNTNWTSYAQNFGETEIAKALEEKTGVKIEYIHPAAGQASTQLSLYAASGELPDLVETDWYSYTGGPELAIQDGLIISLNEYLESGELPNLKAFLDANPEIARSCRTEEGNYYCFPFIRGDAKLMMSSGPIIRKDWMEELGLEMPETIEDMENILMQFKEKKGTTSPLCVNFPNALMFAGAYNNMYVDNGVVKYGVLDDCFKTAVETLNRWYANGLLDENFSSVKTADKQAAILTEKAGVTMGSGGGNLGGWIDSMKDSGTSFDLTGFRLPYAVYLGNVSDAYPGAGSVAISAACKDPLTAAKYLDYGYSEEGIMLYNFGIEGVSYTMVDGKAIYTDEIQANPDGLTQAQAMMKYFRASNQGPFIQDVGYIEQYYAKPQQQEALAAWTTDFDVYNSRRYPKATMTAEENEEYSTIYNEIEGYVDEQVTMFILGTRSLDEYDDFITEVKKLGAERAVELKQAALDRYLANK